MKSGSSLTVLPYSIDHLKTFFAHVAGTTVEAVSEKTHRVFFEGYFQDPGVAAKTIVVEWEYVDHDYLEDFAAYYVRCFEDYERKCARLHFFNISFSEDDFRTLLGGDETKLAVKQLQDSYLGFIVTKPLPHAFVGRTCLKTYTDDGGRRQYMNVRTCEATLFGIKLAVKSLAFQEQDQVVSACATSALWSALHATSVLFQHSLPSPVEITRQAAEHSPVRSRVFPHTDGLQVEQMAFAIRRVGLEPLYVQGDQPPDFVLTPRVLRSSVYAYSSLKIPVILITALLDPTGKHIGNHACTITGFSLPSGAAATGHETRLLSDRIDKLYVHDDQVGPFARMVLVDGATPFHLTTSWGLPRRPGVRAVPFSLLIPLYNKIRIPFSNVLKLITGLDKGLTFFRGISGNPLKLDPEQPTWDVRLTSINEFKNSLSAAPHLTPDQQRGLRLLDLPRFMWRATASTSKGVQIDVLIDATDIDHGRFVRAFFVAETPLRQMLAGFQSTPNGALLSSGLQPEVVQILYDLLVFLRKLHTPLAP